MKKLIKNGIELKSVGIVKPKSDSAITSLSSGLNYSSQLTKHLMDAAMDKPIVKQTATTAEYQCIYRKIFSG